MKRALTLIAASFVCLGLAGTTALVRSQSNSAPSPIIHEITVEEPTGKQPLPDIETTIPSEPDVNVEQQAVRRMLKRSYQMETQQREIRDRIERLSKK